MKLGRVYGKCFTQVSGPGPGGLAEMEVFLPAPVESVPRAGRIKEMSATEPDIQMVGFCPLSSLGTRSGEPFRLPSLNGEPV